MNGRTIGIVALAAVLFVIAAVTLMGPPQGPVASSPTPTASPTQTAAPSVTPTPGASPASPSPTATPSSGRFVNAVLGYSIELTPPWRRSGCFSGTSGAGADASVTDVFLTVRAYDEESGHTGLPHAFVEVHAEPNPEDLSPRQWYERRGREFAGEQASDTTFAGEPALRVSGGERERTFVAHDGRMFQIVTAPGSDQHRDENTAEQRTQLISTFRFLTADEVAAARAAATPTPAPARSADQVADALAQGFAQKDVAVLATVIDEHCVTEAVVPGGGSAKNSQRYLDELRERFARGLTVEVDRSRLTQAPGLDNPNMVLAAVWKEPGQPDIEVDLLISPDREDRWSWGGVLFYTGGRP